MKHWWLTHILSQSFAIFGWWLMGLQGIENGIAFLLITFLAFLISAIANNS